jgi:mannose-6-phosphate isomerase class I
MPFRLKNKVQDYAWGGTTFIPNLIGVESRQ